MPIPFRLDLLDTFFSSLPRTKISDIIAFYLFPDNLLKRFTDKAEDVAKFVIRSDSIDYVKSMNGKPSGLKILKEILNRISGRNVPVENISSFIDKLPPPTSMTIFEYLEAYRKISGLEQVERGNIAIAPENPERSFLKEDRQVEVIAFLIIVRMR